MSSPQETPEPTYTLAEAQAELRRRECATYGHDTTIMWTGAQVPVRLSCDRCGVSWPIGDRQGC